MTFLIEGIDIESFLKARNVFERFRKNLNTEQEKAGAVQAFEFSYELAWKTMKRVLERRGLDVGSPKDTFRKAALEHLIDDPEVWFNFQQKRNLTTHTYNEIYVDKIISSFEGFSAALTALVQNLEKLV
jgi:nucleotidyltransferase substrate binding protein (TIGR01987 family)